MRASAERVSVTRIRATAITVRTSRATTPTPPPPPPRPGRPTPPPRRPRARASSAPRVARPRGSSSPRPPRSASAPTARSRHASRADPTIPVDADDTRLASDGGDTRIETVSIDGDDYRVLTVAVDGGGAYQIARSLDEVERRARFAADAAGRSSAWSVSVRRCSSGGSSRRRVVQPVEQLRDTAERIAVTQDLATPIPAGGAAEIGSLAPELHDDGRRTG